MSKKIKLDDRNARIHPERNKGAVEKSLRELGAGRSIVVDADGVVIGGNAVYAQAVKLGIPIKEIDTKGDELIVVRRVDLATDDPRRKALALADNQIGTLAEWDEVQLEELQTELLGEIDFDVMGFDEPVVPIDDEEAAGEMIDRAEELNEKWQVKRGQIWEIPGKAGVHRVMCGDSTDAGDVALLMDGKVATLCHADPPYGMGKGKEGIANDNLYREKLDNFQMAWWKAFRPSLADNGSTYIWRNAADLWRLWYMRLKDSERLTIRNEIVWDKGGGGFGVGTEAQRSFFPTERCLFFMLGEQGFNNNTDNYWEGWEPIRTYLDGECEKMGWGAKDIDRICGVGMYGHWFTKSQWCFIPEEHYVKLQAAARDYDVFKRDHDKLKRDHDKLKRDFYATRAFFDNTHDNMTDVWQFGPVVGEDRYGHATPKPVDMIRRIVLSSSQSGDIVVDPFLGSGTTAVAAEQEGRICYGCDISEKYVAVTLERLSVLGLEPVMSDG